MAQLETLTALDIGSSKVVCAIAELSPDGNMSIVAHGVAPCSGLRCGALVDSVETVSAIEQAVSQAESSGYSIGPVVVGLTSENLCFKAGCGVAAVGNKDGEVRQEDMRRAQASAGLVDFPSGFEIVSVVTRSYSVDGQRDIANPAGIAGVRLEAESYVCAASLPYLQNVQKIIARAGIESRPNGLLPAAMASALAVLTDDESDIGALVLDFGMGVIDLALYSAKEIGYAAVLGQGGWILTNDVARFFNITKDEAERLITDFGCASPAYLDKAAAEQKITALSASGDALVEVSRRELAEVLEARLQDIIDWVRARLDEAREQHGLTPSSIAITGGGSLLPGLDKRLGEELGLTTRVAVPCCPANLPQYLKSPMYSTVVGLLAFGADMVKQGTDETGEIIPSAGNIFVRIIDWFGRVF